MPHNFSFSGACLEESQLERAMRQEPLRLRRMGGVLYISASGEHVW